MDIHLRNVTETDLPILFEQQADPAANEMANFPARDRDSFMAHWEKICRDERVIVRTIIHQGQVAGNILSFDLNSQREVGYWLGQVFWGKGIASQALAKFLLIEKTRPLHGYVAKHNVASRRVLEKCGFVLSGDDGNDFVLVLK